MIHMMQTNEVYDYTYVWAAHLDSWTLLGDLEDFSKDRLARLIENKTEMRGSFKDRGADRAEVMIPIYGHNEHLFFDGQSLSLSSNGALLMLNTPLMLPGQEVVIHFRNQAPNTAAFNVRAEIVRKNYARSRMNVKSGLQYAVRFTSVSKVGTEMIQKLVQEHMKENKQ